LRDSRSYGGGAKRASASLTASAAGGNVDVHAAVAQNQHTVLGGFGACLGRFELVLALQVLDVGRVLQCRADLGLEVEDTLAFHLLGLGILAGDPFGFARLLQFGVVVLDLGDGQLDWRAAAVLLVAVEARSTEVVTAEHASQFLQEAGADLLLDDVEGGSVVCLVGEVVDQGVARVATGDVLEGRLDRRLHGLGQHNIPAAGVVRVVRIDALVAEAHVLHELPQRAAVESLDVVCARVEHERHHDLEVDDRGLVARRDTDVFLDVGVFVAVGQDVGPGVGGHLVEIIVADVDSTVRAGFDTVVLDTVPRAVTVLDTDLIGADRSASSQGGGEDSQRCGRNDAPSALLRGGHDSCHSFGWVE
jgi:hypothetical protein